MPRPGHEHRSSMKDRVCQGKRLSSRAGGKKPPEAALASPRASFFPRTGGPGLVPNGAGTARIMGLLWIHGSTGLQALVAAQLHRE